MYLSVVALVKLNSDLLNFKLLRLMREKEKKRPILRVFFISFSHFESCLVIASLKLNCVVFKLNLKLNC